MNALKPTWTGKFYSEPAFNGIRLYIHTYNNSTRILSKEVHVKQCLQSVAQYDLSVIPNHHRYSPSSLFKIATTFPAMNLLEETVRLNIRDARRFKMT